MKETNRFRCDKRVHKSHNSIGIPIPTHMTRRRTERELQTGIRTLTQQEAEAEARWFLNLKGGLSNIKEWNQEYAEAYNTAVKTHQILED